MGENRRVMSLVGRFEREEELIGGGMDVSLPDVRIPPIKVSTLPSTPAITPPRRNATLDPRPLYKSPSRVARSKSLRNPADLVEMNDAGYGGPPIDRPVSRSRSRSSRDRREDLTEAVQVAEERELRSSIVARRPRTADELAPGQGVRIIRRPVKSPRASEVEVGELKEERPAQDERFRKLGRSPRTSRVDTTDMLVETMVPRERTPRRSLRSPRVEMVGTDDGDEGVGMQRRGRTRQHKRKVRDPPREPTPVLPVSHAPEFLPPEEPPLQPMEPLDSSTQFPTRSTREASTSERSLGPHAFVDVIMWQDVPRSALLFGGGCFFILSASFMQDMSCGVVTIAAYIALLCLAIAFFHRTFLRRPPMQSSLASPEGWLVTEGNVLDWIRVILPAVNLALRGLRHVFSGDPATTLRVAAVLWLVARVGYTFSLWSFMRFGFFALFTLPKFSALYSNQLCAHGKAVLVRAWVTWSACSHKKALLSTIFLLAWNLSSFPARLCGVFMIIVGLRLYQQTHSSIFESLPAANNGSSAIDRIDRRKVLQHYAKDTGSASVSNDGSGPSPKVPKKEAPA